MLSSKKKWMFNLKIFKLHISLSKLTCNFILLFFGYAVTNGINSVIIFL